MATTTKTVVKTEVADPGVLALMTALDDLPGGGRPTEGPLSEEREVIRLEDLPQDRGFLVEDFSIFRVKSEYPDKVGDGKSAMYQLAITTFLGTKYMVFGGGAGVLSTLRHAEANTISAFPVWGWHWVGGKKGAWESYRGAKKSPTDFISLETQRPKEVVKSTEVIGELGIAF